MLFAVTSCLILGTALGYVDKQAPPQWNSVYTVRGLLTIPYAELEEPFYTWYDSKNGKSRIDYYGGMVKTYQLTPSVYPQFGTNIKVAPVTTEQVLNKDTCLQVNGSLGNVVAVQSVLPDMQDFKYIGCETMRDSETVKWRMVTTVGDKVNKYTMWVKYKKTLKGDTVPIPVRYEMKGYNSLLGSHYDHYYIEYGDYSVEDIDPNVFVVDVGLKCSSFPGPGARHVATFNPMREFVHPIYDDHVHQEFDRFKIKHNKQYANVTEHTKRMNIFRQNLRFVHSKNRGKRTFTMAINHLADWTDDELSALRGRRYTGPNPMGLPFPYSKSVVQEMSVKLPPEFDWRIIGAVTPVKDQSVCGSCWSFGTIGAVEGALFLHNGGHLVRLSQQALVDCSWGFNNHGCDGGLDTNAYEWIMKHGLPTEDDYGGYLGADGYCHIDNVTLVTSIKGWVNVTRNNTKALMLAIFTHGPISVSIDASHKSFDFYSHGVYYEPNCFGNNGCDGGEDFRAYQWIMKHGLPTEEDYGGYLGQDGYCHIDNVTLVTSIKGWVNVTTNDEKALMLALFKHGPISVAIDASHKSFSFYSHGVYYEPDCKNNIDGLDHAVLAVGYGVLNGQHYWLVKNSWSNLWGNQGYVLMSSKDNNCGVMTAPTYVLI